MFKGSALCQDRNYYRENECVAEFPRAQEVLVQDHSKQVNNRANDSGESYPESVTEMGT